ncbi:hypothetical protein ISF_00413 [Cordyceps fumosorosea ARSEF 2679]|uniref:Uncharacterized protein n=1 Tax=Cordyceps fumosorosea (strain ARSEF 2679) TaxID=1081104 RepID=A0A162JTE5_CORFA|nr:hypothetical protein ISF_00413 [Cordyceps fumosorosea ARSEF 2679]OAA73512.1 hypothetical protein ISF_00413 [Cordyceps fumosorosea ARSEF 2679]
MGNICGKQDPEDRLGPGRRLGSAPPPSATRASVPASQAATKKPKQTYQSEARVVGSGGPGGQGAAATPASQAARERWSGGGEKAVEEDRKKQEAQRRKKTGAGRILTAKERDEQEQRWREIDDNDRQVRGQAS